MCILLSLFFTVILSITCCPQVTYAGSIGVNKAPHEVWAKLAGGESQDLIVLFDDSEILAQASQLNKERGVVFDDSKTIRFKKDRYASTKTDVLSALPSGKVEILKDYDTLPLIFLRFHSVEALKAVLAHPSVLRVYDDIKENLLPKDSRP